MRGIYESDCGSLCTRVYLCNSRFLTISVARASGSDEAVSLRSATIVKYCSMKPTSRQPTQRPQRAAEVILFLLSRNNSVTKIYVLFIVCLSHGVIDCYSLNHVLTRKFIYPSNIWSVIPKLGYNRNLITPSFLDCFVSRYFLLYLQLKRHGIKLWNYSQDPLTGGGLTQPRTGREVDFSPPPP